MRHILNFIIASLLDRTEIWSKWVLSEGLLFYATCDVRARDHFADAFDEIKAYVSILHHHVLTTPVLQIPRIAKIVGHCICIYRVERRAVTIWLSWSTYRRVVSVLIWEALESVAHHLAAVVILKARRAVLSWQAGNVVLTAEVDICMVHILHVLVALLTVLLLVPAGSCVRDEARDRVPSSHEVAHSLCWLESTVFAFACDRRGAGLFRVWLLDLRLSYYWISSERILRGVVPDTLRVDTLT